MGERIFPITEESLAYGITTVYNELMELKNNNNIIDLSIENIYNNLDYNNYINDVKLIKNAKYNICFGIGGQFCTSVIFGKSTIVYSKSIEDYTPEFINNKNFKKNNYYFNNTNDFFNLIKNLTSTSYININNIIPSKSRQIERWSKLEEPNIEKLTCIICDYTDLYEKFQKLYVNDLFNAGKLTRHKCSNCGLIFGDLRFLNLSPEEFKNDCEDLYSYYNENFTLLILKLIKSIKLFKNKKFSYLEYECKNKNTIDTLKKNGYNIYGFNKYINNPNILNVIENIKFDVIYVFNFVEHLINPITELQNILSYLNPNGYLIIMSDSLDEYKFEISHYKTHYYLGNSFNILCNKLNLNINSSQIINKIKVKILQKIYNSLK